MLRVVLEDKTNDLQRWNGTFAQGWLLLLNCYPIADDTAEVDGALRRLARGTRDQSSSMVFSGASTPTEHSFRSYCRSASEHPSEESGAQCLGRLPDVDLPGQRKRDSSLIIFLNGVRSSECRFPVAGGKGRAVSVAGETERTHRAPREAKTPIISRLVSLEHPMEIRTGMVFALETYGPDSGGFSAARIKEEVMVTDTGSRVITRFPAEELPIANAY
jgi:hypothetical protein